MTVRWFVAASCAGAMMLGASVASAQAVELSYETAHSSHDLVVNPSGFVVALTMPLARRASLRLSTEQLRSDSRRVGIACAGFIMPGTCEEAEVIRDESTLRGGAVEAVVAPILSPRLDLELSAGAGRRHVVADSYGLTTGRRLSAEKSMLDLLVGARAGISPKPSWPVAIQLGVTASSLGGPSEGVVDGYTPFEQGIELVRWSIGLSIGRRWREGQSR